MFTQDQIEDIVELLYSVSKETKVYIGTDSIRFRKENRWYAKYASVLVVHIDGSKGCKVFSHISVEPDYDVKKNRPRMRMVNEAMKSCELYNQMIPFIDEFDVEIHLDINLDPKFGSNCAAKEAAGYALSTGIIQSKIMFKPNAWCASFAADKWVHA